MIFPKRVPDTIPFSASPESLAEAELSEEEVEDGGHETPGKAERPRLHEAPDIPIRRRLEDRHTVALPEHEIDAPHPAVSSPRTLLHPLEAAQRSRTTTPSGSAVCIFKGGQGKASPLTSFPGQG